MVDKNRIKRRRQERQKEIELRAEIYAKNLGRYYAIVLHTPEFEHMTVKELHNEYTRLANDIEHGYIPPPEVLGSYLLWASVGSTKDLLTSEDIVKMAEHYLDETKRLENALGQLDD